MTTGCLDDGLGDISTVRIVAARTFGISVSWWSEVDDKTILDEVVEGTVGAGGRHSEFRACCSSRELFSGGELVWWTGREDG